MYLKSIELQGFKSFATKTRLEFHNGVTGIVGPNGSGKSNVADAVRWVLGEQSAKQLRGGSMADVIFSGTENRKPLGFASVAITIDNADRKLDYDADEVVVSRKLFRSGESEYRLNGRICRLKDIHELFYDTGIGKEGYSIIGQGQIDKILSGRPDDRRELFDEAAGIVKFKRRKAESLKKLSDEQSNLVRVNDILSEVEKQVGPLREQSEKAEIYLTKRDQLRTDEIMLYQIDVRRAEAQEKDLTQKKQIAAAQLKEAEDQLEKTRKEYDDVEVRLNKLDAEIADARDKAQNAAVAKKQQEGQAGVLEEQIRSARRSTENHRSRLETLKKDIEERTGNIDGYLAEKASLEKDCRDAQTKKEDKESQTAAIEAKISEFQTLAENGRSDIIRLLNDRSTIKERVQRYDTMLEQIEIRKAELNSRMLSMKSEESEEQKKLKKLEDELKRSADAAADKQQELDAIQKKLADCKQRMTEDNSRLEEVQTSWHRESSRLESLRSITENYEGYANSIRKVMEQKEHNPGIHGVVADLIHTEEKYETAIETALGGALQNIVTDNESTAKYLIEYLKRGHFGRATFLPLTAVRGEKAPENHNVLAEEGVIGMADALVQYDSIYSGIVNRLLGRTVVVDTIDHAIAVSRKYHQSVRMVTLTGELLSPGGSMTGGSFRYKNNLLGRKRQIAELEQLTRKLKKEIDRLQQDIIDTKQVRNGARDSLSRTTEEMQQLSLQLTKARVNYDNGAKRTDVLRQEYETLLKEKQEIEHQVAEIHEKNKQINEELTHSEASEQELQGQVREMTEQSDSLQQDLRKARDAQNEAVLAYNSIRQQMNFLDDKIHTEREEIDRLKAETAQVTEDIERDSGDVDEKQKQLEDLRKADEGTEREIAAAEARVASLQAEKEKMNADHRQFFEERDRLTGEKGDLEQEIFRLDAQLEKVQNACDEQISNLYEQYQLTPDQAEEVKFENIPERGTLKKEISRLRADIQRLGAVNVNAVEQYRELKERYDFLKTQHDDLIKATDELNGIIRRLDEGMRKQFREKFGAIQTEYDKVFKELFGGGHGELQLAEDEDILEAGITIIAQPPGKKLQNMMQLSGGEKALTAISLLFAIQNLKPSPFCLLDEIEAALDDNNVGRFAGYLHKLTKNTQFIVITHRRGTMAAADRLYGITMQEKGVSTLVSVDLIESELDA